MFGTISFFFNADIGVGQGFALLPISSMLYIALIFHILEKKQKIYQLQILFVVIVLFLLSSNNSNLLLNIISLRFFIFLD